jgi:hypothetical protein
MRLPNRSTAGVGATRRGRLIRRTATIAVLLLAGALGSVAVPTAASAAPTCSDWYCDNTNPHTTGCDAGATTVGSQYIRYNGITLALVELRWSTVCYTNWSRITSLVSTFNEIKVHAYRNAPIGSTAYEGLIRGGYGTSFYSDQLYGRFWMVCAEGWITINGYEYPGAVICG